MSKQDPADQVKFLVSCIGHTSNGRPDFQAVAEELEIVTKAAAQKRYERMLKAHGISRPGALAATNNGDEGADTPPATPTKRKAKGEATGSAKKSRTPRSKAKKESDDDEESKPKPKPKAAAAKRKVKKEEQEQEQNEEQNEAAADSHSSLSDAPPSDES
ncbi:hypothetical protein FLONG3_8715 [Fusarium longipes]|uniref:Myb-like DNA-binding domain-containing protein n=1 Tax=Fusarium longipes TaxID=694270 RepID=A0A395S367_9HYPO|nr:hypothetical protein FLONG3_8715 [Fusarium longipes]